MYGYRTKHKILAYYVSQVKGVPPPKIRLTKFSKSVKGVNENVVATYLLDMKFEGYFNFYDVPKPENDQDVEITYEGMAAFIGEHFLKKNRDLFWKGAMNISITLANIAVAIVAIIALTKDNSELRQLEDRLKRLEQVKSKEEVRANPNKEGLQSSGQSKPKDSVTKIGTN